MKEKLYQIVTVDKSVLMKKDEMLDTLHQVGTNRIGRDEIQGEPIIHGFLPPVYNGMIAGCICIRYESQRAYEKYSK